jgi:formate-dependent phosphoribosylglycinamide formyltransferase (GAR transformylase)
VAAAAGANVLGAVGLGPDSVSLSNGEAYSVQLASKTLSLMVVMTMILGTQQSGKRNTPLPTNVQSSDHAWSLRRTQAPKILLTDTSSFPGSSRLAISLSKSGCDVSAVCSIPDHPLLKVRSVRETFHYSSIRPLNSLQSAIEKCQPQIIIPCDDCAVQHLHELYVRARHLGTSGQNLAALIERSLGAPESYPVVSSRYALLALAREEGLPVPQTKLIQTLSDLKRWCVEETRSVVVKADGTWGGNGVRIAHTARQAQQFFLELSRRPNIFGVIGRLLLNRHRFWLRSWWTRVRPKTIGQQYICGRPGNCAVLCWNGRILAGITVEVVSTRHPNGPATVVRVVDNPQMLLCAERLAHRLGLSGFFGLDFMIENATETIYLIEMNPRCTQLSHIQLGRKRDLIGALSTQLSDQALQENPPVTQNDLIAYFPEAWTCKSDVLQSSFQDVPLDEPDLTAALLRPSSARTFLGRSVDSFRRLATRVRTSGTLCVRNSGDKPNVKASQTAQTAEG